MTPTQAIFKAVNVFGNDPNVRIGSTIETEVGTWRVANKPNAHTLPSYRMWVFVNTTTGDTILING